LKRHSDHNYYFTPEKTCPGCKKTSTKEFTQLKET
jgi:uncharacterized OB-fold protein